MKYILLSLVFWGLYIGCSQAAYEPCFNDGQWFPHGYRITISNRQYECRHGRWVVID